MFADVGGELPFHSPCIYREIVCCITDVSCDVTVATSRAGGAVIYSGNADSQYQEADTLYCASLVPSGDQRV